MQLEDLFKIITALLDDVTDDEGFLGCYEHNTTECRKRPDECQLVDDSGLKRFDCIHREQEHLAPICANVTLLRTEEALQHRCSVFDAERAKCRASTAKDTCDDPDTGYDFCRASTLQIITSLKMATHIVM